MPKYEGPRPEAAETFEFFPNRERTSYDIPLAGKVIDEGWLFGFNAWLGKHQGQRSVFITSIQSRYWYDLGDFALGQDNHPSYIRHEAIVLDSTVIADGLVLSGTMLRDSESEVELPVVMLSHPIIQESPPLYASTETGPQVAIPLVEDSIGLLLRLTRVRLK